MELSQTLRSTEGESPARLWVTVIHGDSVATHPLPEQGTLEIGRAEECALCIDDPEISRQHARLFVERAGIEVEDLGSVNGTRLRGRRLEPGARERVHTGEVIELGATMLVFQSAASRPARRRLMSHAYFEVRLEEECARKRSPFALL